MPKINVTSISPELKSLIQQYYPNEQYKPNQEERIIEYLERYLENDFNQYKAFKGYTPNETLLKVLVMYCLRPSDVSWESENDKDTSYYFGYSKPYNLHQGYTGRFAPFAEYEIFVFLSSLDSIGSDGGGGNYFVSTSGGSDQLFHTYETFEGIEIMSEGVSELLEKMDDPIEEISRMVIKEFQFLTENHKYNPKEPDMKKEELERMMHLSMGLTFVNSEFMPDINFNFSMAYFKDYFESKESDYYLYDNVVANVNSRLVAALYQLYFTGHIELMEQLITVASGKIKGRQVGSFLSFFRYFVMAKRELKKRIVVNVVG